MDKFNRMKLLSGGGSLPSLDLTQHECSLIPSNQPDKALIPSPFSQSMPGKQDSASDAHVNLTSNTEGLKIARDSSQIYCPIKAILRLPYRHFKGDLGPLIANKFFSEGKIWRRTWTLYYIRPPIDISTAPLLLVPLHEVQQLVNEINAEFSAKFEIPSNIEAGLMIPFPKNVVTMPEKLGCSTSQEMKDHLVLAIPLPVSGPPFDKSVASADPENESLRALFRQWMDAAVDATKNQSRGDKEKKKLARITKRHGLVRAVKRAQRYFGLRPGYSYKDTRDPENEYMAGEEYKIARYRYRMQYENSLCPLNPALPAPYDFADEPVFISIDVEAYEFAHDQVTEVGISVLDTLDIKGCGPFETTSPWFSKIRSRHFRILERSHIVNHQFLTGCPGAFNFGESEFIRLRNIAEAVEACFRPPYSAQSPMGCDGEIVQATQTQSSIAPYKLRERKIVLVGHNVDADITYLRNLGCPIFSQPLQGTLVDSDRRQPFEFLDTMDTASLFQLLKRENSPRSLTCILNCLNVPAWNLHNAGNDARYTMHVLIAMVIKSRLIDNEILNQVDTANKWWPFGSPTLCEARAKINTPRKDFVFAYDRAWKAEVERRLSGVAGDKKKYVSDDSEVWELATNWKGGSWVDEDDLDGGRAKRMND